MCHSNLRDKNTFPCFPDFGKTPGCKVTGMIKNTAIFLGLKNRGKVGIFTPNKHRNCSGTGNTDQKIGVFQTYSWTSPDIPFYWLVGRSSPWCSLEKSVPFNPDRSVHTHTQNSHTAQWLASLKTQNAKKKKTQMAFWDILRTCFARIKCSRVCGMVPSVAATTRMAPSICAVPFIMFCRN